MDRSLFTAKFKRDYVAASAVVIFFLIVISEVTLAIGIPAYLLRSNLWAVQIQRQHLLSEFDQARRYVRGEKFREADAEEENKLVLLTLNMMANYLRLRGDKLSSDEAGTLRRDISDLRLLTGRLTKGRPFSRARELDPSEFLKRQSAMIAPAPDQLKVQP